MKAVQEAAASLKRKLAEGLRQADRGEFAGRSVMDIAREIIAEGSFTTEETADIMQEAESIAAIERGKGVSVDKVIDEHDAISMKRRRTPRLAHRIVRIALGLDRCRSRSDKSVKSSKGALLRLRRRT